MTGSRPLAIAIALVSVLGIAVAGYLTVIHYTGASSICAVVHGCEVVQKSDWSKLAGIPVALLGLVGYVVILGSLAVRGEAGLLGGAVVALGGFGFSMYLTYREAVSINAWCMWCVISAVLMTVLAILTVARLLKAEPAAHADDHARYDDAELDEAHYSHS